MSKHKGCIDNYLSALLANETDTAKLDLLDHVVQLSTALVSNDNVWVILTSPLMSLSEKQTFLETFSNRLNIDTKVRHLFVAIVKNKRLTILSDLMIACRDMKDRLRGVSNIELISNEKFSSDQVSSLEKALLTLGYPTCNITYTIDSNLVAGFKIKTDDKVYDMTLRSVLNAFKDKINRS